MFGGVDVYTAMLSFDFAAMVLCCVSVTELRVTLLQVWSLLYVTLDSKHNPNNTVDTEGGGIPVSLFFVLFVQFAFMLTDRMVYCYQSVQWKMLHQVASVMVFHGVLLYNPPMQLRSPVNQEQQTCRTLSRSDAVGQHLVLVEVWILGSLRSTNPPWLR